MEISIEVESNLDHRIASFTWNLISEEKNHQTEKYYSLFNWYVLIVGICVQPKLVERVAQFA